MNSWVLQIGNWHSDVDHFIDVTGTIYDIFLKVNESFTTVYSGGRDRRVWATDLRNPESRVLICEEQAPILKVFCMVYVEFGFSAKNVRVSCL